MEARQELLNECAQLREEWKESRRLSAKEVLWRDYSHILYEVLSLHQEQLAQTQGPDKEEKLGEIAKDIAAFNEQRSAVTSNGRPGMLDLKEHDFAAYYLSGVDLSFTNLSDANFTGATLEQANLTGARCHRTVFRAAHGEGIDFFKTDCREASLIWADFQKAQCPLAEFQRADFNSANFEGANLGQADLTGANLFRTKLAGADLSWSRLCDAIIREETDIGITRFFDCDLEGSTLYKARERLLTVDLQPVMRPEERTGEYQRAIDVHERFARHFAQAGDEEAARSFQARAVELTDGIARVRRVFLSYARESEAHISWVRKLAQHLTDHGLEALVDDQVVRSGHDFVVYMDRGIENADRIVVVGTEEYVRKAGMEEGGVAHECRTIRRLVSVDKAPGRVIPVVRSYRENPMEAIPDFLRSRKAIDLHDDTRFEKGVEDLTRALLERPASFS